MKKKIFTIWIFVLLGLIACSQTGADISTRVVSTPTTSVENEQLTTAGAITETIPAASETKGKTHDEESDYSWDNTQASQISLNVNSITAEGNGVTINGSQAIITAAGTYLISGSLVDGQIVVNSPDENLVRLILNGVDIHNSTTSAIYIADAEKTMIVLADGSSNLVSDATTYEFAKAEEDEPNAAIFSKSDLTIYGNGNLSVQGNFKDGITSKDGLIISSGRISVTAIDDGMRGKDYLVIKDGEISVNAGGDGLKSDNTDESAPGFVFIQTGLITITAGGDAISAESEVEIDGGEFTITSGGGASTYISGDTSAKGIKGQTGVNITYGIFGINSADDAIHSNGDITINGGTYTLLTGDDGMHADSSLTINNGQININQSYEGLESAVTTINGGDINIIASDDGINVAGGKDASGWGQGIDQWMNPEMPQGTAPDAQQMPQPGQRGGIRAGRGGGPGQDAFALSGNYFLYINGGNVHVDASGDGIDVNGSIEMKGGVVLVNGPTEQMNGALDCIGSFNISGGYLIAVGSVGMAEAPDESSSQNSVLVNIQSTLQAGTLVHVQNSYGEEVLTFAPTKPYQSVVFSMPALHQGETYEIYFGGSSTGDQEYGLFQGGSYTPGIQYGSITISSIVTMLGGGVGFRH